jgi:hypothetical protein
LQQINRCFSNLGIFPIYRIFVRGSRPAARTVVGRSFGF